MAKPNPDEMPRNSAASGADSKYGRSPSGSLPRRPLSQVVVILYGERRVVREALLLVDRHASRGRGELRRCDLVVDAPAHVLGIGLPAVAPPGIALARRLRAKPAVDVNPAQLVEDPGEPCALLRQETGV